MRVFFKFYFVNLHGRMGMDRMPRFNENVKGNVEKPITLLEVQESI